MKDILIVKKSLLRFLTRKVTKQSHKPSEHNFKVEFYFQKKLQEKFAASDFNTVFVKLSD